LNDTIYSLTTATGTTLAIAADTFTVTNQAGAITNAGTIAVNSTATLAIDQGLIKNTGLIAVSGTLNIGSYLSSGNLTLQGGGNLTLSGTNAGISVNGTNATITNADNTISGVGDLSLFSSTLINQSSGIIDASGSGLETGSNNLFIDAHSLNNLGTMETTGYGSLYISGTGTTITNSGVIEGAWNISGSLNNSNMIEATGANAYDLITGPVLNTGNIEVLGTANLTITWCYYGRRQ
jgi:hypothetical protein